MAEAVLADGERREVELGWDYEVVREVLTENVSSLDEVTEPYSWNGTDGTTTSWSGTGRSSSIIDHERAFYG